MASMGVDQSLSVLLDAQPPDSVTPFRMFGRCSGRSEYPHSRIGSVVAIEGCQESKGEAFFKLLRLQGTEDSRRVLASFLLLSFTGGISEGTSGGFSWKGL